VSLYSIAAFSVAEGVSGHSVVKISTKNSEEPRLLKGRGAVDFLEDAPSCCVFRDTMGSHPIVILKRGGSQKVFDFLVCFCEAHQISRFAPPDFFAPYMPRIDVAARRKVV
jgi:hypothetical protein